MTKICNNMVCKVKKLIFLILYLSLLFPYNSISSMSAASEDEVRGLLKKVYHNTTSKDFDPSEIVDASFKLLNILKNYPKDQDPPRYIIKAAGLAFGQLAFLSPNALQFFDNILVPYLRKGLLTYPDLRTPYYDFKFGERYSRLEMDQDKILKEMPNGQRLTQHYYLNYPVYFNRLLAEFTGEYLLIGGGRQCECLESEKRHPLKLFYHIDIDNRHMPDMVIHAAYLEHLYTIPTEKFSLIWFEHCTIGEMIQDTRILEQYFRLAKPGGIFILQSNMISPTQGVRQINEITFQELQKQLQHYKFSIVEYKDDYVVRRNKRKPFKQLIFVKPYKIDDSEPLYPLKANEKINLENYRQPTSIENYFSLQRAHLILGQINVILRFPLSSIIPQSDKKFVVEEKSSVSP